MGDAIVTPCRPDNAIRIVAFAFAFERMLDPEDLAKLKNAHQGAQDELPRVVPQRGLNIRLGADGDVAHDSAQPMSGILFDRLSPTGEPEWAFSARDNSLIVQSALYTRWSDMWTKAKEFFDRFGSEVSNGKSVVSVTLEYVDEFTINEPEKDWKSELFNIDSPYIAGVVFGVDDFWHCHTGYLASPDHLSGSMLTRVDIDYLKDHLQNNKIVLKTQHQIRYDNAIPYSDFRSGFLDSAVDFMHEGNKKTLGDILSLEMRSRIGLEAYNAS